MFLKGELISNMKKNVNSTNNNHLQFSTDDNNNDEWTINASQFSKSTCNPVRKLVEQMKIEPNPDLQMIALSIGDPTILSNLGKPDTVRNAIIKYVQVNRTSFENFYNKIKQKLISIILRIKNLMAILPLMALNWRDKQSLSIHRDLRN